MIAHLLAGWHAAATETAAPAQLDRHLDGIAAILESHFRYEVRTLLAVRDTLTLNASREDVLGPL